MPIGAKMPKLRGRVEITYGNPLTFERYYDRAKDRFVLRSVTDEIMYEIMILSDQEYVDEYASRVKKEMAEAEPTEIKEPAEERQRSGHPSE
jgi:1-acyl-sn-glycerol-3-phosphate acyltransferase